MKTKKMSLLAVIFGLVWLCLSTPASAIGLEKAVDFTLTVNCPITSQQALLNSLTNGGFNLVNTALASSLEVVSDSTDYLIGFFVFLFLLASVLIIANIKRRFTLRHFKLLPALAWRRPTETFLQVVIADSEGNWSSSYSQHRFYHQLGTAGFWGALASVGVKLFLIFFLSSAIFQLKPSVAQENFVGNCQIKSGETMDYRISLANLDDEPMAVAIVQPLADDLGKISSLQANLGQPQLIGDEITLRTEIKGQERLVISYQTTAVNAGEVEHLAYALVSRGSEKATIKSKKLALKVEDGPVVSPKAVGQIANVIGQLTKIQPINQSAVKAGFKVSGQGGSLVILVWQSEPIIQTFAPTSANWTYETELVLAPGNHSLIVSGKDQNGQELNQVGPIYFQVPGQPIGQPVAFGQIPASQTKFFQLFIDFINDPAIEKANEQTMAPILLALALANAVVAISLTNLWLFFQYLLSGLFVFSRRRHLDWGAVYDSVTKEPIDLAVVRLYSKDFHHLVQTRITGQNGRYLFIVKKSGKYHLTIAKAGYIFPTKALKGKKEDAKYHGLYHGQSIVVKPGLPRGKAGGKHGLITLNVPLDPIKKIKKTSNWRFSLLRLRLSKAGRLFHNIIGGSVIVLATGALIIFPKPLMLVLWLFQVILYLLGRRLNY
ncbi:MAG: carboxypeptidase-like regulatory domain-containing protein [bacterium]